MASRVMDAQVAWGVGLEGVLFGTGLSPHPTGPCPGFSSLLLCESISALILHFFNMCIIHFIITKYELSSSESVMDIGGVLTLPLGSL